MGAKVKTWHQVALALVAVLAPLLAALQAATFTYAVSIERRLTRLETIAGVHFRNAPAIAAPAPRLVEVKNSLPPASSSSTSSSSSSPAAWCSSSCADRHVQALEHALAFPRGPP